LKAASPEALTMRVDADAAFKFKIHGGISASDFESSASSR
jgi:hypothetical protein